MPRPQRTCPHKTLRQLGRWQAATAATTRRCQRRVRAGRRPRRPTCTAYPVVSVRGHRLPGYGRCTVADGLGPTATYLSRDGRGVAPSGGNGSDVYRVRRSTVRCWRSMCRRLRTHPVLDQGGVPLVVVTAVAQPPRTAVTPRVDPAVGVGRALNVRGECQRVAITACNGFEVDVNLNVPDQQGVCVFGERTGPSV